MKYLAKVFAIVLVAFSLSGLNVFAQGDGFSDVDDKTLYKGAILELQESGIVAGYDDGTFKPDATVNRAELLKIIAEAAALDSASIESSSFESLKNTADCFTDAPAGEWYTGYLCYAKAFAWVGGYSDGSFRPDQNVTFAEALKITFKGYDLIYTEPRDDSPWYMDAVVDAIESDIIPVSIGTDYEKDITRGEMADLIFRLNLALKEEDLTVSDEDSAHSGLVKHVDSILYAEEDYWGAYIALTDGDDGSEVTAAFEKFKDELEDIDEYYSETDFEDYQQVFVDGYNDAYKPFVDEYVAAVQVFIDELAEDGFNWEAMSHYFGELDQYSYDFVEEHNALIDIINEQADPVPVVMQLVPETGDSVATIETNYGEIKVLLYTEHAPTTTSNFIGLAEGEYYDGVTFHRVIDDFMIQAGDFTNGDGTGGHSLMGPGTTIVDEFVSGLEHIKGTLSMANAGPGTAGSQFFIVQADEGTPWLDGSHSIFGFVYEGLDVVDEIAGVDTETDKPVEDVLIETITVSTY